MKTSPFNILYIEDDSFTRKATSYILQNFCTNLIIAIDGIDGLQKFKSEKIHLIITDINMPKLNGMAMIKQIREINPTVPIIIISAYNEINLLHDSINCGVQGYIVKPINMKELSSTITKIKLHHTKNSLIHTATEEDHTLDFGQHRLIDDINALDSTIIVLIKIEEFKYVNSSLTSKISKKLQKRFAKRLLNYMPNHCGFSKIYILENGAFVFVKEYQEKIHHNVQEEIKAFQQRVNNAKIKIGLVDYTLSIIISLAYGDNAFENAQAGLQCLLINKEEYILANALIENEKSQAIKKLETFKMLKTAIDSYNIISYFQPIVNNQTKKIEKYESLVRLIDENKQIISPNFFLDIAKESKYYQQISSIVLQNSFQALYATDMNISINLSSLDIEQSKTKEEFFILLEKHKKEAHRIVVELLEDERIHNTNTIKNFIKEIKRYNVKIAIDDFGVGFSNFSRVLSYQPDFIKIDGSLIKNIELDNFSRNMVETIVSFAKKENIQTIAEYVENEKIFHILCQIGVDYSQGYYFGKPSILKKNL